MKRNGDNNIHVSEFSTHGERLWLTPSTRIQTSEREYNDLTATNRRPSTPCSQNTPLSFSRGTRSYAFPRSTKHVYTSLACYQDFWKIWWRVEFCSVVTYYWRDENSTGYHPALVQLFRGIFLQSTWGTLSREAKERKDPIVGALTPVSLYVYRGDNDQFANWSSANILLATFLTSKSNDETSLRHVKAQSPRKRLETRNQGSVKKKVTVIGEWKYVRTTPRKRWSQDRKSRNRHGVVS